MAEPYTACTNSMSTDQTPTVDEIIAACKELKKVCDDYQHRMKLDAHLIQCEWCKPAAVWKNNTLWLCPHYLGALKELPKSAWELSITENMEVDVSGLRIGAIQSPEFAETMLGEVSLRWGSL